MKAALKYLAGIAGPSGYGSNSTADQVTQQSFYPPNLLTAIITGNYFLNLLLIILSFVIPCNRDERIDLSVGDENH